MSPTPPESPELELPDVAPPSVDIDGELHLAELQQAFAGAEAKPVRYRQWEVEKLLGTGGMGRVYLARHLALDRRVALKIVAQTRGANEEAQALRVIREAQALARVKHQNVLAIHQVDTSGERTVIEMEYVEGSTLQTWQADPGRDWRTIVEAYADAADGLAAIHAAGLLHRDIKPTNLLVDADNRVKVADLGLAIAASRDGKTDEAAGDRTQDVVLGLPLTAAGGLVGTHGYMAPEVIAGDEASPASDQFSLAVSLYEAVYGTRPFVGDTPRELALAMRNKSLAEPSTRAWRPRWLRRCLARALSFEPGQRYPSVAALAADLRWRLRLRRLLLGAGAAIAILTGVGAGVWFAKPLPPDPCAQIGDELASVWSPERRDSIVAATGTPDETNLALGLLLQTIDAQAEAWTTARTQWCASVVAHQDAPDSIEARLDAQQDACLRYNRRHLAVLVDALANDAGGLSSRHAELAEAVDGLPSCTQRLQLGDWAPVERDDESDAQLSEALAAEIAGDYAKAITLARSVADRTKDSDPFRHVQALYRLGRALGLDRQDREALDVLAQARNAAFVIGHDELICRASAFEARLQAGVHYDVARARRDLEFTDACTKRVSARSSLLEADLVEVRGLLAHAANVPVQAIASHRKALELRKKLLGDKHPSVAKSKLNLANAMASADPATIDEAEIVRLYVEAIELRELSYGPDHPEVAHALFDLGDFYRLREQTELARAAFLRTEEIYAKAEGEHARARLKLHLALANIAMFESQLEEAHVRLDQAASLHIENMDVRIEHATLRELQGMLALREGDFRQAADALRQATRLHDRLDPGGPASLSCMALEIDANSGLRDHARIVALARDGGPELRAHMQSIDPAACGAIAWHAAEALMGAGERDLARAYLELAHRSYVQLGEAEFIEEIQQLLTTLDHHPPTP